MHDVGCLCRADKPSAGPADRDSGTLSDQADPPDADNPSTYGGTGELPPQATPPAVPPYEGRKQSADIVHSSASQVGGANVGGAARPVADPEYKAAAPVDTPGGATASPADEQPASQASETEGDDGADVGPAHAAGTGRAEDKR